MRIRKNAKVSSLLLTSSSDDHLLHLLLQPHVCQLNQSPWDAPLSLSSPPLLQFQRQDSFTGTVSSLNDSAPALESFPEGAEAEEDEEGKQQPSNNRIISGYHEEEEEEEEEKVSVKGRKVTAGMRKQKKKKNKKGGGSTSAKPSCQKSDGKGWHCKNEAADGNSMCGYHLSRCSSSVIGGNNDNAIARKGGAAAGSTRRARKKGPGSNPYEFYYYSGFGPSWGRRRGSGVDAREEDGQIGNFSGVGDNNSTVTSPTYTTPSSDISSPVNESSEHFGFVVNASDDLDIVEEEEEEEEEEDEDEGGGSGGKKRMRKPVKARSLKSLM